MGIETVLAIFFSFIIGAIFGGMAAFLLRRVMFGWQMRVAERKAAKMVAEARKESKNVVQEAHDEAKKIKTSAETEYRERRSELQRQENRLTQKGENLDRKLDGVEQRERNLTAKEKEMTAYHESGHLVVLYLIHPTKDVFKASIVSHKGALGVVQPQPKEELHTHSRESLITDIKVSLSGYIAEKIKYGTTSSGVAQDFKTAMNIAHVMVWNLGMGDSGFVGDYSTIPDAELSDATKEKLNAETQSVMQRCLKETEELLKKEWNIVERFVKELLEKEELEYDDIDAIFKEFGKHHPKEEKLLKKEEKSEE